MLARSVCFGACLVLSSLVALQGQVFGDVPVFQQLPLLGAPGAPYPGQDIPSTINDTGSPITSESVADDFELSAPATITSITWWGAPFNTPDPDYFNVGIGSGGSFVGGELFAQPGFGNGIPYYKATPVSDPGETPLFEKYDATFSTPITLQANTLYSLSITNQDITRTEQFLDWGWHARDYSIQDPYAAGDHLVGTVGGLPVYSFGAAATSTSPPASPTSLNYAAGTDGPAGIQNFGMDMAFVLYATPEPSTFALGAAGAIIFLVASRRRRNRS